MSYYKHDVVVPFKDSNLTKKQQVAEMFNRIAFRYDLLNRLLSGGIDVYWRKKAIRELLSLKPKQILDVATGTADMPVMMMKYLQPEKITAIDISEGMLDIGRKKISKLNLSRNVELQTGDSESINFPDNSFDATTVSFGVRNFEFLEKGLEEMRRVLKPGGKLVVLEFSKPKNNTFKILCNFYFRFITPGVGKLISKNKEAYQYLDKSVEAFPEGDNFLDILKKTGYVNCYRKPLTLGICTIYCGSKSEPRFT
ncbi:MAG: bifunctional demethylmenaquinone methyltransferase/2-methoxy-6-polyprenyl-1,4-benzoquinol methylase UbiE [Bacteroidetes bacterium]|nr:bifunctional demethylmenaquinone methyltransferase/2-methoxy-6-polyprenyl-1,4-benzoquinol methylase UbiE [Bacteroidota bacterium]